MAEDEEYLRAFFQRLEDGPLEPEDQRYVPIYAEPATSEDPVATLDAGIEWAADGSVQLLSGFRGTGKSTELRRLRASLRSKGYKVALCDMKGYLDLSTPVDVSDFLVSTTGALSEVLASDELLGRDEKREGYFERFSNWLSKTEIELAGPEVSVPGSARIRANLKNDPSFRRRLQKALEGSLGSLVEDVRQFVASCKEGLKQKHGPDSELVVIFDSVEQFQGTNTNAKDVQASLETLFVGHADKLRFPGVHVIYTVPPWLKIRYPGVSQVYTGAYLLPCIKVRERDGQPYQAGLDILERIIRERGRYDRLLGGREALERLILHSGGYLRDLFKLLQASLRRARVRKMPLSDGDIDFIIARARDDYLPIALDDAKWLRRVAKTHEAELLHANDLPDLSRYFDTHLLLCYRNGEEWYDIHPLIAEKVQALASRAEPDGHEEP